MENARRHEPTRSWLQTIRLREVENAVVASVPSLEALANIFSRGAWLKAKVGMGEVAVGGIELRREVVTLRLALSAYEFGLLLTLMEVVRNGAEVVEELAIDRPAAVGFPHGLADYARAFRSNRFFEREALAGRGNKAEPFVVSAVFVHG